MNTLRLHLKFEYFDAIKSGQKKEEYRLANDYWKRRLDGRHYRWIHLYRGYPKKGDSDGLIICRYNGWIRKRITHPHFGSEPVEVFAFKIEEM